MLFDEFCHCHCHESNNVKHIMACCDTCSFCKRRVKWGDYEEHVKNCENKYDPKVNGIRISQILDAMKTLEDANLDISSIGAQVSKLLPLVFGK